METPHQESKTPEKIFGRGATIQLVSTQGIDERRGMGTIRA